jgi:hypothetical protein
VNRLGSVEAGFCRLVVGEADDLTVVVGLLTVVVELARRDVAAVAVQAAVVDHSTYSSVASFDLVNTTGPRRRIIYLGLVEPGQRLGRAWRPQCVSGRDQSRLLRAQRRSASLCGRSELATTGDEQLRGDVDTDAARALNELAAPVTPSAPREDRA